MYKVYITVTLNKTRINTQYPVPTGTDSSVPAAPITAHTKSRPYRDGQFSMVLIYFKAKSIPSLQGRIVLSLNFSSHRYCDPVPTGTDSSALIAATEVFIPSRPYRDGQFRERRGWSEFCHIPSLQGRIVLSFSLYCIPRSYPVPTGTDSSQNNNLKEFLHSSRPYRDGQFLED